MRCFSSFVPLLALEAHTAGKARVREVNPNPNPGANFIQLHYGESSLRLASIAGYTMHTIARGVGEVGGEREEVGGGKRGKVAKGSKGTTLSQSSVSAPTGMFQYRLYTTPVYTSL